MPKDKQSSSKLAFFRGRSKAQGLKLAVLKFPKPPPLIDNEARTAALLEFEKAIKKQLLFRQYYVIAKVQYEIISLKNPQGEYQVYIIDPTIIGKGNDGTVKRAQNLHQQHSCAVKITNLTQTPRHHRSEHAVKHEQHALSFLKLLTGVSSIRLEDGNQRDYTFMKFIPGKPLASYLYSKTKDGASTSIVKHTLHINHIIQIAQQLVQQLKLIKKGDIIHRDISAVNILVNGINMATLIDFGSCKTGLAFTLAPVETFGYLLQDFDVDEKNRIIYTPQSDLLSFAIVLCECLSKHDFACYRAKILSQIEFHRSMTLEELRDGMPDILRVDLNDIIDPVKKRLISLLRLIIENPPHLRPKLSGVITELSHLYQTTIQKTHSDSGLVDKLETPRTGDRRKTLSSIGTPFRYSTTALDGKAASSSTTRSSTRPSSINLG